MDKKLYTPLIIAAALVIFLPSLRAEEKITHFGGTQVKAETKEPETVVGKAEMRDLLAALADPDFNKRINAQWKLRVIRDKALVPELVKLLNDKRPYVKQLSCELLGEIGDKSCLPDIANLLINDTNTNVKETCARVLSAIGNRSIVYALIEALNQPRPLSEGIAYWVFPADIYDNYRYAVVSTLNKLTNSNFFFRRNETNFSCIAEQRKINTWWKENKYFFTKEIDDLADHVKKLEELSKSFKAKVKKENYSNIAGGEDLSRNTFIFADKTKAFQGMISILPSNKELVPPALDELDELVNYIDEIFIYSAEVAEMKPEWETQKALFKKIETMARGLNIPAAKDNKKGVNKKATDSNRK